MCDQVVVGATSCARPAACACVHALLTRLASGALLQGLAVGGEAAADALVEALHVDSEPLPRKHPAPPRLDLDRVRGRSTRSLFERGPEDAVTNHYQPNPLSCRREASHSVEE